MLGDSFPLAAALVACAGLVAASPTFSKRQTTTSPTFDWSSLASSSKLKWSPCYDGGFQCANLEVPLDYSSPAHGDVFKLAVIKLPAQPTVPYQGQFWMFQAFEGNVDFIQSAGPFFQAGLPGFDFMAFDYRGSSHSTPALKCFPNQQSQDAYAAQVRGGTQLGEFNGTYLHTTKNIHDNIVQVGSFMKKFGDGCNKYFGKYLPYMGSPDAARDLHHIVSQFPKSVFKYMWFYSYSTVVGTTYAAMYPNSFDRMLLDGQTDTVKVYQSGDNDPTSIQDASVAEQIFYDSCAAAPRCNATDTLGTCEGCYFWAPTPQAVKARYEAVKAKYYKKPFQSNPPSSACGTCTTTHFDIATTLVDAVMYPAAPLDMMTVMSLRLLELESGHAFPGGAIEYLTSFTPSQTFSPMTIATRCMDAGCSLYRDDVGGFAAYLDRMNRTSNQLGPVVAAQELWCANWPKSLRLRHPDQSKWRNIETSGELLFVSNVANPIQSFANTDAMARRFHNASLLLSNAVGSTDLNSGFSQCQIGYETAFEAGTLPPYKVFCNDYTAGPFGIGYQKDYRNQREMP